MGSGCADRREHVVMRAIGLEDRLIALVGKENAQRVLTRAEQNRKELSGILTILLGSYQWQS